MKTVERRRAWPESAAIYGASGGIGSALCHELRARGVETIHAGSRSGKVPDVSGLVPFRFDLDDEPSVVSAAESMRPTRPDLVIVATGVLTLPDGTGPERSYRSLDPTSMERVWRINTLGPAIIAKHMLPLFPRDRRCVFAALSARVGSISDNRIGGWHSYRASKAGLNMLLKNFALELGRTHRQAIVAGLHPGTVDTRLSKPFQANLPEGQLTAPEGAARHLLAVLDRLEPADSGRVFDWKGERIPD